MRFFKLFVIFLLFFLYQIGLSQQFDIKHITVRDGLLAMQIYSAVQDDSGFIYFATLGGVSKFDGVNFQDITIDNGIAENATYYIYKDFNGNLWFGHRNGKISFLNKKDNSVKVFTLSQKYLSSEKSRNDIGKIFQLSNGEIWLRNYSYELFYIKDDTIKKINIKNYKKNVYSISLLQDSVYWAGGEKSILILKREDEKFAIIDSIVLSKNKSIYIDNIIQLNQTQILIKTYYGGLYIYNLKNKTKKHITKKDGLLFNDIYNVYWDSTNQRIWVIYVKEGLSYIDLNNNYRIIYNFINQKGLPLQYATITDILVDNENNVWILTDSKGIYQIRTFNIFYYKFEHPKDNSIWAILKDKNTLWVGTERSIIKYDLNNNSYNTFTKILNKEVYQAVFFHKQEDKIWMVFSDRLIYYNKANNKFYNTTLSYNRKYAVGSIVVDSKLWIKFATGELIIFDLQTQKFKNINKDININKITGISNINDSIYIIDHNNKIYTYEYFSPDSLKLLNIDSSLHKYTISKIIKDSQGYLWAIGVNGKVFKKCHGKFLDLSNKISGKGLSIFTAFTKDSLLWLATNKGIIAYNIFNEQRFDFCYSNGFNISECNEGAVEIDSDNIYFGTVEGIVRLNTNIMKEFELKNKLIVNEIKIDNNLMPFKKNIILTDTKNLIYIKFNQIFFKFPELVRFRYKIGNLTSNWIYLNKQREFVLTYLPIGNYQLYLQSTIDNINWKDYNNTINFKVSIKIYKQEKFYFTILVIIILSIAYMSIKRRQDRKYKKSLEEEVEKRTKELKESEEKFKLFSQINPVATFIFKNKKIIFVNDAVEKLTGYKKEELLQRTFRKFFYKPIRKLIFNEIKRIIKNEIPISILEVPAIDKNGTKKWLRLIIKQLKMAEEVSLIVAVTDITELKKAYNEIKNEKELLQVTLTTIADGVIAVNKNGNIMFINSNAQKLLSIDSSYIKRINLAEIFKLKRDENEFIYPLKKVLSENIRATLKGTGILVRNDNKDIHIVYSISPIITDSNKITGAVIAFDDITYQKKYEEEIIKKQKLETIGILAGGIAHDFNNFLTAIIGNLSLIKTKLLNPPFDILKQIENIESVVNRASLLTNQLLTFSKGDILIKDSVDISKIIKEVLIFTLSGSNIKLNISSDENLPLMYIDVGQISQVFQNLTVNAIQAIDKNGVIEVKIKKYKNNGEIPIKETDLIEIEFKDNGKGIPQEILSHIFDPFFTTKKGGSGLGLATVDSIIKKHNGFIKVESQVGKGTTFFIYLPVLKKVEEIEKEQEFDIGKYKNSGEGTILVMDDEEIICEMYKEILGFLGFDTIVTYDGEQALEVYKKNLKQDREIKCIIMDLTVPGGMGGQDAIKEFRKIDKNIIIIVSSGYADGPIMSEYKKYGFNARLKKPFNFKEVIQLFKKLNLLT